MTCQYTGLMRDCRTCGKSFRPIANQQYCGEPCVSATKVFFERKGAKCRGCGAHIEDGRFGYCSDDCRPKREPKLRIPLDLSRTCERCGTSWEPKSRKVKTKLCQGCREADRQLHVYSGQQGWRKAVRNRAKGLCEECGASEQDTGAYHHAHHIVARAEGGQHTLANGKFLCVNCHDSVHGGGALGATLLVAAQSSEAIIDQIAKRVVELLKAESLV